MASPVLEERGYFWWSTEVIPEKQFAPDSMVTGALRIDDDGIATLELDATLPDHGGPMGAFFPPSPDPLRERAIAGLLRSGKHVLLAKLERHGGRWSSNGISHSGYKAFECLVGGDHITEDYKGLRVRQVRVDISEYADWMRRGPIRVEHTGNRITAEYVGDLAKIYNMSGGTLAIKVDVSAPHPYVGGYSRISIKEFVCLVLETDQGLSIEDGRTRFSMLEDLFVLLTDSDHCLAWPEFSFQPEGPRFTHYFWRTRISAEVPDWHRCWVGWEDVKDTLGRVFQAFCEKRELFGPGFFMYLGLRRGTKVVVENRFVNMIWGLEAFHRTLKPEGESPNALKEKIDRILGDVQLPKDKRWLARKLENAGEPSLAERLFDVFKGLPLDLQEDRLRSFCEECASLRNDISHFGGRREPGGDYNEFLRSVMRVSEALACLYHTLLLQELGIGAVRLKWWVYEGFHSFKYKSALVDAGLADKELTKPKSLAPARTATPPAAPAESGGNQGKDDSGPAESAYQTTGRPMLE